jgi:peptidoglycan/xylan/chitin deacetylase (PgdA/CDA1 family)
VSADASVARPLAAPEAVGVRGEGRLAALGERVARRLASHLAKAPFTLGNAGPIASFTFDDVPETALTAGARLVEEAGARGTFYVSGGLMGQRAPDWRVLGPEGVAALHRAGHEIGCHTYAHAAASRLGRTALLAELDRNRACLAAAVPGLGLDNFAFPYGAASPSAKRALVRRFTTSRGIVPKLNAGRVDLQNLAAFPLVDGAFDPAGLDRLLDETVARNAWAIFYTHDVAERPSRFGCTPRLLAHALAAAGRRGIAVATVAEALRLAGRRG